jgi:hypothetical protein
MLRSSASRRPRLAPTVALGLTIAMTTTTGCSFRLVRPAPPREDWPARGSGNTSEVRCTATLAPPVVDFTLAAGVATLGYVERNSGTSTAALGLALLSLPFLASSIYGTYNITKCRRYQSAIVDAAAPAPAP